MLDTMHKSIKQQIAANAAVNTNANANANANNDNDLNGDEDDEGNFTRPPPLAIGSSCLALARRFGNRLAIVRLARPRRKKKEQSYGGGKAYRQC